MRLALVDHTSNPHNHPPHGALTAISAAGDLIARRCARDWGDNVTTILGQLDGYPIYLRDELPEAVGALAYHDNDPTIGPYSKVGVGTILGHGGTWLTGSVSVVNAALHEVLEMLCDPIANRWADQNQTVSWAQELCDGVENLTIRLRVQVQAGGPLIDVDVPDYVLPSYFNPFGKPPFDAAGKCDAAFSYKQGYAIKREGNTVSAVFADGTPELIVAARTHARSRYAIRGGQPLVPAE